VVAAFVFRTGARDFEIWAARDAAYISNESTMDLVAAHSGGLGYGCRKIPE